MNIVGEGRDSIGASVFAERHVARFGRNRARGRKEENKRKIRLGRGKFLMLD